MAKKKRKISEGDPEVELNVMPFIDIFSLLCTFLLFSAVFVSMGIIEVQIPFFTNASNPSNKKDKPEREIVLKVNIEDKNIDLITSFSLPPLSEKTQKFQHTASGLKELHLRLKELKNQNSEADKITIFADDSIRYQRFIHVLDAIKLKRFIKDGNTSQGSSSNKKEDMLFPKIIVGSVIL